MLNCPELLLLICLAQGFFLSLHYNLEKEPMTHIDFTSFNSLIQLVDFFDSVVKTCGWFLSCQLETGLQGHEAWQFEKKIDNDATSELMSHQFIFHLCPTSRLQKILNVGLTPPKTTLKAFMLVNEHTFRDRLGQHYGLMTIDRVYEFLNQPNDDFLKNNTFNTKVIFTSTYTLLQIDTSKLLPNTNFSFDPRSEDAVYTMSNIPPTIICKI